MATQDDVRQAIIDAIVKSHPARGAAGDCKVSSFAPEPAQTSVAFIQTQPMGAQLGMEVRPDTYVKLQAVTGALNELTRLPHRIETEGDWPDTSKRFGKARAQLRDALRDEVGGKPVDATAVEAAIAEATLRLGGREPVSE